MSNLLHILNGDSTAQTLGKSSVHGDVIVWREMLCDGALHKDVGSDEFWKLRYNFFENELGVSKLDYFDKTIKELVKLEDISDYDEIVLWFEFDLFCQVNLMALCSFLLKYYRKDKNYYLICTGKEKGKDRLQTLSDYTPVAYQKLYKNKVKLNRNNLLFAQECWQLFVENDVEKLKEFNFNQQAKYQYFQDAIDQHLKRFPKENELNQIDNKILEIIQSGNLKRSEIIRTMLLWQRKETVYGFGDLQYLMHLDKLSEYYHIIENYYQLNSNGKSIVNVKT